MGDCVKNNIISKIWFFAAICFIIAGILGKNTIFIVLGCVYICIGCSNLKKKTKTKDNSEIK